MSWCFRAACTDVAGCEEDVAGYDTVYDREHPDVLSVLQNGVPSVAKIVTM